VVVDVDVGDDAINASSAGMLLGVRTDGKRSSDIFADGLCPVQLDHGTCLRTVNGRSERWRPDCRWFLRGRRLVRLIRLATSERRKFLGGVVVGGNTN
jgi:hypothetical protein